MSSAKKPVPALAGLVVRKGAAAAAADVAPRQVEPPTVEALGASPAARSAPLNFRVTEEFRRRFRVYAAQHDLSLSDLLERAFEAYERATETGKG